ncbi:hypothetical protein CsatA_023401 [Cannabis sativa]
MPTNLDHPSNFETLALDSEMKNFIINDLQKFLKRKDYYRKVGKAWKRGYLLYGPPGIGKSSLIASMANYLNFDVYDLELSKLNNDSDLRRVLVAMANRSILVIEDIDCSINFEDRNRAVTECEENKVTLSGLLNFIDGLWSCCGDERIIIFTTNHKERLDPALVRPAVSIIKHYTSQVTSNGSEAPVVDQEDVTVAGDSTTRDELASAAVKLQKLYKDYQICKDKDEAEVWFSGLKALISRGHHRKWRNEFRSDGIASEANKPRTYTRRSSPLHSPFGGDLLLRNKFIIIIYRGKDFLPCEIADLISKREMELQRCQLHEEHARLEVVGKFCVADEPQGNPQSAGTLSEFHDIQLEYRDSVEENRMVKLPLEAEKERIEREIRKQERKLFILSSKIEKSTKDLLKLNAAWKPSEKDADQEMLTDEERECFRMIGMKMHSVLVLGKEKLPYITDFIA